MPLWSAGIVLAPGWLGWESSGTGGSAGTEWTVEGCEICGSFFCFEVVWMCVSPPLPGVAILRIQLNYSLLFSTFSTVMRRPWGHQGLPLSPTFRGGIDTWGKVGTPGARVLVLPQQKPWCTDRYHLFDSHPQLECKFEFITPFPLRDNINPCWGLVNSN